MIITMSNPETGYYVKIVLMLKAGDKSTAQCNYFVLGWSKVAAPLKKFSHFSHSLKTIA